MNELPIDKLIKPLVAPKSFDDFIGQDRAKKLLSQLLEAAKKRNELPDNVLFVAQPGCGKSSLAQLIGDNIPVIIVSNLSAETLCHQISWNTKNKIIFLDEFMHLRKGVAETLNYFMDTGSVLIKGRKENLGHMTILAATTATHGVSQALISRFGLVLNLDPYTQSDLTAIVLAAAPKLNVVISKDVATAIAKCSRNVPRIALRIMKRVRDWYNKPTITNFYEVTSRLGINADGTTTEDTKLLSAIKYSFGGGPVGLETLAAYLGTSAQDVEEDKEPFLIQQGLLSRTPSGRVLTNKGINLV